MKFAFDVLAELGLLAPSSAIIMGSMDGVYGYDTTRVLCVMLVARAGIDV